MHAWQSAGLLVFPSCHQEGEVLVPWQVPVIQLLTLGALHPALKAGVAAGELGPILLGVPLVLLRCDQQLGDIVWAWT